MPSPTASIHDSFQAKTDPHSCVENLPTELLCSIFFFAVDRRVILPPSPIPGHDARWTVVRVCRAWRTAVLSSIELWNDVVVRLDAEPAPKLGIIDIAHHVISRARQSPLCLTVQMSKFRTQSSHDLLADEFIDKFIIPFTKSLKSLRLFVPFPFIRALLTLSCQVTFPMLEVLSLRQASVGALKAPILNFTKLKTVEVSLTFPSLHQLNFIPWGTLSTFINCRPMDADKFLDLLFVCSSLKSCAVVLEEMLQHTWSSKITLPFLERLHIRFYDIDGFDHFLLQCLELPSIRDLALKEAIRGLGWTPLLNEFLTNNCGSQLEELFVASSFSHSEEFNHDGFDEFLLQHSSSLRKLYIPLFPIGILDNRLVRQLVSRELCPGLEKLSLELYRYPIKDRLTAIWNGLSDAEGEGREPVIDLHLYVWYEGFFPKEAEAELSRKIEKWGLPCTSHFSSTRGRFNLEQLEEQWFGFSA